MPSIIMLSVEFYYCCAQCHFAEYPYAECHSPECLYAECHYAECHYAECHYAECNYAECPGACCSIGTYSTEAVFLVTCDPSMNEL
jgi:hypothetical protein